MTGNEQIPWMEEFVLKHKPFYPEFAKRSDEDFLDTWGSYSRDILEVIWCDWLNTRDEEFLTYDYVRRMAPKFHFYPGMSYDDIFEFSKLEPWKGNVPLPDWVLKQRRKEDTGDR